MVAEGFPAMIRGRGTDTRRKYQSLLKTYKEIEDWNSKSGKSCSSLAFVTPCGCRNVRMRAVTTNMVVMAD